MRKYPVAQDKKDKKVVNLMDRLKQKNDEQQDTNAAVTVNDQEIISFVKVCEYLSNLGISQSADIQIIDDEIIIKVNNYCEYQEHQHLPIEYATNLQKTGLLPIGEDISEDQIIETFSTLTHSLILSGDDDEAEEK